MPSCCHYWQRVRPCLAEHSPAGRRSTRVTEAMLPPPPEPSSLEPQVSELHCHAVALARSPWWPAVALPWMFDAMRCPQIPLPLRWWCLRRQTQPNSSVWICDLASDRKNSEFSCWQLAFILSSSIFTSMFGIYIYSHSKVYVYLVSSYIFPSMF